jgi:hypothetical protein
LASEIPVVGTFFGSLVGSVLGTLVGGLFDPHIVPWSQEMVGAVNGVLGINYWNWNSTGNPQEFTSLSNMVAGNANQVLALTRRDPNIMNITGLTSLNELVFNQLGSTRSSEMNKTSNIFYNLRRTSCKHANKRSSFSYSQARPGGGKRRLDRALGTHNRLLSIRHIPAVFTRQSVCHVAV